MPQLLQSQRRSNNMKQPSPSILALAAVAASSSSVSTVSAFTSTSTSQQQLLSNIHHHQQHENCASSTTRLFSEEPSSSTKSPPLASKSLEEGSHDELMYALGVNLARQLGDVRPLVESSEELTQLARGLLDTVVGKIDDEDQRALLGRRGDDLNKVIVERA